MILDVILGCIGQTKALPRRTIYIPESAEELVRAHGREGESFSATIVRLAELGVREDESNVPLDYIGAGSSGLPDLGINAEKYLGLKPWDPGEEPDDEGSD